MKKRELVLIFIAIIINTLFILKVNEDELWCFGFAYNIANGLIPYKDFNMVVTPFFALFNGLFLFLIKNSLIYYIINALCLTSIVYLIGKRINRLSYLILIILFPLMQPNYSILGLLLVFIIMYLEENKKNEILIGVLIGLTILTKQTVGVFVLLAGILFINKKQLIKRLVGISISLLIFGTYLLISNSFIEFIDYTVLGLFSFAKKNSVFSGLIFIWILVIIISIYYYIKKKDRSPYFKYSFLYLFSAIPLFDPYHIIFSIIPLLVFGLSKVSIPKKYGYMLIGLTVFSFALNCYPVIVEYNKGNMILLENKQVLKYRGINKKVYTLISKLEKELTITKYADYKIYLFTNATYLIKMEAGIPINKYDLINYGNMGYNGIEKYIKEIKKTCAKEKCLLVTYPENFTTTNQQSLEIINYVRKNYKVNYIDDYIYYTNDI